MNDNMKLTTVFAAGIVAGAILGILFAPGKGCKTRNNILESGKKFTDKINKKTEIFADLEEKIERAVTEAVTEDAEEML